MAAYLRLELMVALDFLELANVGNYSFLDENCLHENIVNCHSFDRIAIVKGCDDVLDVMEALLHSFDRHLLVVRNTGSDALLMNIEVSVLSY
jgi:hypothetical protein